MRPLTLADAPNIVLGLQDEIRRSQESRYDHRLHGVLLMAQGMTCPEVGYLLGDAPRSVEYWVQRFESRGLAGLQEGERSGRPRRLADRQLAEIGRVLRQNPRDAGMKTNIRDGQTLSAWIEQHYGKELGVRQCQRLFRRLGFRLRKPRPEVASSDPELKRAHKKTPKAGARPQGGPVGPR